MRRQMPRLPLCWEQPKKCAGIMSSNCRFCSSRSGILSTVPRVCTTCQQAGMHQNKSGKPQQGAPAFGSPKWPGSTVDYSRSLAHVLALLASLPLAGPQRKLVPSPTSAKRGPPISLQLQLAPQATQSTCSLSLSLSTISVTVRQA